MLEEVFSAGHFRLLMGLPFSAPCALPWRSPLMSGCLWERVARVSMFDSAIFPSLPSSFPPFLFFSGYVYFRLEVSADVDCGNDHEAFNRIVQ